MLSARKISGMIRAADAAGYNLYWERGEHLARLRVIRARTRTIRNKGDMFPETVTEIYTLPDGSLVFAATRGTEGSRGTVAAARADKPHPDAVLVAGGPDYVNAYRSSP